MRAGTVGRVERKEARVELLHADAAVGAGVILAEQQLLTADDLHTCEIVREAEGGLERSAQAALDAGLDNEAVDDGFNRMLIFLSSLGTSSSA